MRLDVVNDKKFVAGLLPLVRTASASFEVDTQGFNGITIEADIGAPGITLDATNKIELKMEHSDVSGSGHVAVAATDVILPATRPAKLVAPDANGTIASLTANADASQIYGWGYRGSKRFVKVTLVYGGTHATGTPASIAAVLEEPEFRPA